MRGLELESVAEGVGMKIMGQEEFQALAILIQMARRRGWIFFSNGKLVHYTTSSVLLSILENNSVWMRNVRVMNDFMEVEHGVGIMRRFFRPPSKEFPDVGREAFINALNSIFPDLFEKTISIMNSWLPAIINDSYITCISEHLKEEDQNGRLSLWRAYGSGSAGVALVINPLPLYSVSDAIGAYSIPVSYFDDGQYFSFLRSVTDNINKSRDVLIGLGRDVVEGYLFNLMLFSAICCKHPGFSEEREWRIIHVPKMWGNDVIKRSTQIVSGVPQSVYKIPLQDIPGQIEGISIQSIIHKIIIGPTDYPDTVRQALLEELKVRGISDAEQKLVASQIPLRNGY